MKNIIVITGAGSGIGAEFAIQIDTAFSNIDEIWLIARRRERLEEVARVMEHTTRVLPMDVTDEYAVDDLEKLFEKEQVTVRMLINAAGFGHIGFFDEMPLEDQLNMLYVNCEALTKITYITLPYMAGGSRIIQMSSCAAFIPQPEFAVYAATKSYVLSLSRALNEELAYRNITVTAVCPGPVNTEFFEIAEEYGDTMPIKKLVMISAEKCVKSALRASYHKLPLVVPGLPMKAFALLTKHIPHDWILKCVNIYKEV